MLNKIALDRDHCTEVKEIVQIQGYHEHLTVKVDDC